MCARVDCDLGWGIGWHYRALACALPLLRRGARWRRYIRVPPSRVVISRLGTYSARTALHDYIPGGQALGWTSEGSPKDQDQGVDMDFGYLGISTDLIPCNNPSRYPPLLITHGTWPIKAPWGHPYNASHLSLSTHNHRVFSSEIPSSPTNLPPGIPLVDLPNKQSDSWRAKWGRFLKSPYGEFDGIEIWRLLLHQRQHPDVGRRRILLHVW